jgi:hypothetical protein
MFNKENEFFKYINDEFIKSGYKTLRQLGKNHKYINTALIDNIGGSYISSKTDINIIRHNKDEYSKNFYMLIKQFGRIPLYMEFKQNTKISLPSYISFFKFQNNNYDNIVKLYCDKNEYLKYFKYKKKVISENGKITGKLSRKYTDKDLKKEFKHVFDFCKEEFGVYPSSKLFQKLSLIDTRTYRKRFKKSFSEIAKMYGYKINKKQFKCEKITLDLIAKILNTTYKSQKTWNWLMGAGKAHMYCDGFYTDYDLVVEFDGKQHSTPVKDFGGEKSFKRLQENDKLKDKLLPEHGIKLIRINYDKPFYDKKYLKQVLINNNIIKP